MYNNSSAPKLWALTQWLDKTCLHYWSSRSEHRGMRRWLKYIIETSRNKHRVTIHIEEYILKLHIHQHSLLTRKVFFRHDFQHWSSSLYQLDHLCIQVIFVFKSSSSLDLDHLSIWIIMGHHHWIWIITGSRSSWGIITGYGSSLDLDHHWISSLDLDHHWTSSLDLDHHSI